MWDLDRPFEEDSSLELITFKGKDKGGNKVINSDAQVCSSYLNKCRLKGFTYKKILSLAYA